MQVILWLVPLLRHGDTDIFDFIGGLAEGSLYMIAAGLFILGFILFSALYQWLTGESFVKSKKERRRARERRYHVLWKYESDD